MHTMKGPPWNCPTRLWYNKKDFNTCNSWIHISHTSYGEIFFKNPPIHHFLFSCYYFVCSCFFIVSTIHVVLRSPSCRCAFWKLTSQYIIFNFLSFVRHNVIHQCMKEARFSYVKQVFLYDSVLGIEPRLINFHQSRRWQGVFLYSQGKKARKSFYLRCNLLYGSFSI